MKRADYSVGAKSYMRKGFLVYEDMHKYFHHMRRSLVIYRVSSKWKKKFRFEPKQTETRSVSRLFRFVSWNQKFFFGLFWCFEPISKQPKQTELFRNEPKQSGMFWKSIIYLPRVLCLSYLSYIYLGSSVCHIPVIFLSSCRPVIVAECWAILDVLIIKLTKETRRRVSRGRD